jgi:hypothetical protein
VCRGRRVQRTTTTADGTYSFQLTGRDTQDFFGTASSFSVSAEAGGAAVTAGFKVQTENLRLPDLRTWEPRVTFGAGRIQWDVRDGAAVYQVTMEDNAGQPVWSFATRTAEVAFDPRILEDTAGTLAVSVRDRTTAEGTTVGILRRSGRVEYRSTAGTPVSRGRPCGVSPCPLTDGDFTTRLPQPATTTTTSGTRDGHHRPGPADRRVPRRGAGLLMPGGRLD